MMEHIPVLVERVLEFLKVEAGGVYVDCTAGTGGHSEGILRGGAGLLLGFDLDIEQLKIARTKLQKTGGRFFLIKTNYRFIDNLLKIEVDGILIDAGVSSFQMEEERGFSFRKAGELDMRFNRNYGERAIDFLKNADVEELADVLYRYGQIRSARTIARIIKNGEVESADELVALLRRTFRRERAHKEIAKVFQAIRIKVNRELENLEKVIKGSYQVLKRGGRLVAITYHSGEDKTVLKSAKEAGFALITKKPVRPDKNEFKLNPRSRSARLRVFEK